MTEHQGTGSIDAGTQWGRYELLQNLQSLSFLVAQANIAKTATVQLTRNTRSLLDNQCAYFAQK